MILQGKLRAICVSERKGTRKQPVECARLIAGYGIEGDAHAGKWHRQVSLLAYPKIMEFKAQGAEVEDGDFGENLVVEDIDLATLPVGSLLRCGEVLLRVSQLGKECHQHCQIYHRMGDCIMPRQGIFAEVLQGGELRPGDCLQVSLPAPDAPLRAAVITLSDKGSRGERVDESGPLAAEMLSAAGFEVVESLLLSDDEEPLKAALMRLADKRQVHLIVTSGGTGFSPRDHAPEATLAVIDRQAPGIAEAIRASSMQYTKRAMLSRAVAGLRGSSLIINLPGSPKAVREALDFVLDVLPHGLEVLRGVAQNCARQD